MTQFDPFDSDFLPDGYETPKSPSRYLTLEDGDSVRLRIISSPIMFWEWWTEDKKAIRTKFVSGDIIQTPANAKKGESGRFVWAMVIWNYTENMVQIWSIKQNKIRDFLVGNAKDPDIGNPKKYDIKISRKGSGINDTQYTMAALLKPENMVEIDSNILTEAKLVNLEAILEHDGDPFAV